MIFTYISHVLLLCIVFSHSTAYVESFIPLPRYSVSSILVDSKLYFFGGWGKNPDESEGCQNSVFYLDILSSFDTSDNIPWIDLTSIAALPVGTCWQVSAHDSQKNSIYILEGLMVNNSSNQVNVSDTLIYSFDTKIQRWSKPIISGIAPPRRMELQISQDSSSIYMFGGLSKPLTGSQNITWFSDMNILDIKNLSWLIVVTSGLDLPPPQADFTATILNNGMIVYIGGRQVTNAYGSEISYKQMDKIWTYDTKKSFWNLIVASGTIPGVRTGHSAVLAMDGRIIVYGGKENEELLSPATPDLAVLDTASTPPFQWSTPKAFNAPPILAHHSATLIGNVMIIAFGKYITLNYSYVFCISYIF
ncbi:galactose oxidase [Gigaspora margarita]|uniref:Galactose oxidase n=1 Tax=Gigaspora margarita TaxID=4874 RepID=A0A8H4EG10_GIGMA|nr:galactose oxidase [Gigaspora margarita]